MKLLITTLITACVLLSGACDNYRYDVDESIYKIPNQDKALLMLERNIEDFYGNGLFLDNLFMDSNFLFVRGEPCPYNSQDSVIITDKGMCVGGIMTSCREMYVAIPDDPVEDLTVCGTALLHEHGHCIRQFLGLANSNSHPDKEFWAVIQETNKYVCGRDW